jgi:hypothetical protein
MLLAGARIGELLGWWTVDRLGLIAAHFHLAAFGFAGLTAVGVGSRMLPMFLMAPPAPGWLLRAIGPTAATGLLALGVGLTWRMAPATWLGTMILAFAGVLYLVLVTGYLSRRGVRRLDPALAHVALAFGFLAGALVAGVVLVAQPGLSPRGWTVYAVLTLLGWLTLLIVGIYYRVFPFLLWLHIVGPRLRSPRAPAPDELVNPRLAWASLFAFGIGVGLLAFGTGTGSVDLARAGALGFCAGSVLTATQYVRIVLSRPSGEGRPSSGRRRPLPQLMT